MSSRGKKDAEVLKEAKEFVRQAQRKLRKSRKVPEDARRRVEERLGELRHAVASGDAEAVAAARAEIEPFVVEHLGPVEASPMREFVESAGLAILVALMLRAFVIEAFKIPTGSMIPTLLVGDHIFVNKFIYGIRVPFTQTFLARFAEPERGEVVVFTFPSQEARAYIETRPIGERECIDQGSLRHEKDFIKRIVGVEGDRVELKDNQLYVNGEKLPREFVRFESTGNYLFPKQIHALESNGEATYEIQYTGEHPEFGPITVAEDHVFVMGDNRDNSSDGRCWGQVPVENVKGKAMFIWWALGRDGIHWDRIGQGID